MLSVTIRKRKQLVRVKVTKKGQALVDKRQLPASALAVTGIGVFAQPGSVPTVIDPVFLHGAFAQLPTNGALLTPGVLSLAGGGLPTRAAFSESAGAGKHIYYGYPATLPPPIFEYMGFRGGFIEAGSLYADVLVDQLPKQVAFRLWRSVTANLGDNVALTVSHP